MSSTRREAAKTARQLKNWEKAESEIRKDLAKAGSASETKAEPKPVGDGLSLSLKPSEAATVRSQSGSEA